MKLKGIVGKGSGKVANAVFRVRSGVQIVSQYQPKVANPCTNKQVHRRAVFKLVAQLSADLLQYIAIPWVKRVSPRNRFERLNYQLLTYNDGVASINLEQVQLTDSSIGMPDFMADRSSRQYIELRLIGDAPIALDKVVYVACTKSEDGALMPFDETVVTTADGNTRFIGRLQYTPKEVVIYAYGIRINSEKARTAFGNMLVQSATEVANLVTASHNVSVGTNLTATKGLTMSIPQQIYTTLSNVFFNVQIDGTPWNDDVHISEDQHTATFNTIPEFNGMYCRFLLNSSQVPPSLGRISTAIVTTVVISNSNCKISRSNSTIPSYWYLTIGHYIDSASFMVDFVYKYCLIRR